MLRLITTEPGIILSDLKAALGLHNGVATYHLSLLEQADLIRSAPAPLDRRARCFFPITWSRSEPPHRLSRNQHAVIQYLTENPGSTVSAMARHITPRYRQQSLDYTVKRLEEAGYLRREPGRGATLRWFVMDNEDSDDQT